MGVLAYGKLALAGIIAGGLIWAGWTVNDWRNDSRQLSKITQSLEQITAERDALKVAVAVWQKSANEQKARADTAEAAAQIVHVEGRTKTVYVQPPPVTPGEICAERRMLAWLVSEYQSLRSSWQ